MKSNTHNFLGNLKPLEENFRSVNITICFKIFSALLDLSKLPTKDKLSPHQVSGWCGITIIN